MRRLRRPARITVVAAALSVLAACSGTESDGGDPDPSPSAPARTLTAGEIETAAVDGSDVPDHQVGAREAADRYEDSEVSASQPECVVQARVALGMNVGDPASTAQRTAMGNPPGVKSAAGDLVKTTVTLASYKGKGKDKSEDKGGGEGEEKVLYDLGLASTACRSGFTSTVRGEQTPVQSPPQEDAPEGLDFADEYTWFTLTGKPGDDVPTHRVLVVRSGHTLGFFSRTYPGPAADTLSTAMPFPVDVARAQWKKLAAE
ncbi:hypothetical protein GCM10010449_39510 [Streptomyces rectiviolaceus]|uniref:Lipoprotein n=2 Tax=Streptomyces rectiviolaceus TaxID=332591 RepID=A0ABP6MJS3_9ACTN